MDLISIIVPVYNVKQYIEDCLESIIAQTYQNLEIILVDDGSNDGSEDICEKMADRDERIQVVHQANQGLSAARNTGLDRMQGKYVVFVDSDDFIHPEMIECLYSALKGNEADLAFCSHIRFKDGNHYHFLQASKKKDFQILSGRECIKNFNGKNALDMVVVWNKLYQKKIFETLRFPMGKIHEDEFINYKILYPLTKCVYVISPMYYYRIRKGSITQNNKFDIKLMNKLEALKERKDYFKMAGDEELYSFTLRKYATASAELIICMKGADIKDKHLMKKMEADFIKKYRTEIIKNPYIGVGDKLKYALFLFNKTIYKNLKNIQESIKNGE